MAKDGLLFLFLLAVVAAQSGRARAQGVPLASVAPPPGPDCLTVLTNKLVDCFAYAMVGSNETVPDKPCCSGLASVVKSTPICLCSLLGANASDYGIDMNRALKLPSACGLKTPDPSLCRRNGSSSPSPSPSLSRTPPPAPSKSGNGPISPKSPAPAPSPYVLTPIRSPVSAPSPSEVTPASATAPGVDCQSLLISNLASCFSFVMPGSNERVPNDTCCSGLSSIVKNTPKCLCSLLNGNSSNNFGVNMSRALKLPSACGIKQNLDPSQCSLNSTSLAPASPGGSTETSAPQPPPQGSGATPSFAVSSGMLLAGLFGGIAAILLVTTT